MRVRTIEVPLCDLCTRDGVMFQVLDPTGQFTAFTIVRCDRHLDKLRASAEAEEQVPTKGTGGHKLDRFCEVCGYGPTSGTGLASHMRGHERHSDRSKNAGRQWTCPVCGLVVSMQNRSRHVKRHHPEEADALLSNRGRRPKRDPAQGSLA